MRGPRGFTLVEVLVYSALFLLVGLLLAQMFNLSRKTQRTTASAYAVTGQTDTAIDWIRNDLLYTALGSIRTYPGSSALLTPAIHMASARVMAGNDEQSKLLISEFGAPAWSYHVFYGLRSKPGERTGSLVRWEVPYPLAEQDRVPKIAIMPTTLNQVPAPRVILQNVLCPRQKVNQLGGLTDGYQASEWGGFRVEFLRRRGGEGGEEFYSTENPSENVKQAADNTRLLEVELCVCETSMGAPNFYSIKFRVNPRY